MSEEISARKQKKLERQKKLEEMRARAEAAQSSGTSSGGAKRPRGPHGGGAAARMMGGEKPQDFKGAIKKLVKYLGPYKYALIAVGFFAAASTVFNVIGPKVLGMATTVLADGVAAKMAGTGGIDYQQIATILAIVLLLYLISSALVFAQGWIMTTITQRICNRMRTEIAAKVNRMPLGYFESHATGDVLSRVTNDVDTLGQSLNQSITTLISAFVTVLGIIIVMLTISPLMTLIALIVIPVSVLVIALVVKRSQGYFFAQQEYLGKVNGQVEEVYSGQDIVKAFNCEGKVTAEFDETNETLYTAGWKSQFLSGLMMPLMNTIANIGYVGVAISGAALAIRGTITIGDIQAFIQYVKNLTQPIQQLAQVMNMLQSMAAAAERVFIILEEEEEDPDGEECVDVPDEIETIEFDHVRFGYDPEKVIIKDFCAKVEKGQTVALVGPTGAGKTTMVKLLMRFYDVNGGAIRINGTDIRDFRRSDLRDVFGMVLQDAALFRGSIMENIRFGRLDATDEEVVEAAKAALADHFIRALPGGYDMEINEDATNVSQGQRQLLTIARALLADHQILILDEATSSVDTRTEARIQEAMDTLMKDRTSFVIAHRLSTIKNADLILVLRDGDIVEQGNHEELMTAGGFYAELYNSQFERVG